MQLSPRYNFRYPELTDQVSAFPPDVAAQNALLLDQVIGSLADTTTEALAGKAPSSHTHTMGQVTGLDTALAGKAPSSHTHTMGQVTGLDTALAGKAPTSHTHTMGQVTGLDTALAGKANQTTLDTRVPSALALRLDTTVGTRIFAGNTMIYGDTGLRALAVWDADGALSYGEFPTGLTFNPGSSGGIWLRRVTDTVSLYIAGAKLASGFPNMKVLPGFYPSGGPYPDVRMNTSTGTMKISVGGGTIFMFGTVGDNIPASSGSYRGLTQWSVDTAWPTALPGIPG